MLLHANRVMIIMFLTLSLEFLLSYFLVQFFLSKIMASDDTDHLLKGREDGEREREREREREAR